MPTTVNLKVKQGEEFSNRQYQIEDITLGQFNELMTVIKDIIQQTKNDQALKNAFNNMFAAGESNANLDMELLSHLIDSFETLAVTMPEHATKLLSVLSGIEVHVLKDQKMMMVLDVYDAVIEENDVERLTNRVKKSLALTAGKIKMKNFVNQLTKGSPSQKPSHTNSALN